MVRYSTKEVRSLFIGEYRHSLDVKGRIIVPAKFRDGLGDKFVLTKGLDGCLFAYSKEDGTPSARLDGHLRKTVKVKRLNKLGKINQQNSRERNEKFVGQVVKVIYEDIDYDKKMFIGRTLYDAPEIDGNVYFSGDFVDVGNVYDVKITACDDYDLYGELV